jgi:pantothenate kinase
MKVFKYPLVQDPTALQYVEMPAEAMMLHVGEQHGELYVWALVSELATKVNYKFFVIGTGVSMDHIEFNAQFVGTAQMQNGLVWHVFYKAGE